MKTRILAFAGLALAALLSSCTTAEIQTAAQDLATATKAAEPLASNKTLSNILYGLNDVATAYGTAPVPANILGETAILPGLASTITPLITGKANGPKTQSIITAAAGILAAYTGPAATTADPVTTGS